MGITAIAFDFGTKSIGCAVGQSITGTAQALPAFKAQDGIPNWDAIEKCLTRCHCGGIAFKYGWYLARFNTSCEKIC